MNSRDVRLDSCFKSACVGASSEWTGELGLKVDRCNVNGHVLDAREGLVTSTPTAGHLFSLEMHSSDVCIEISLVSGRQVTRGTSERSFA